MKPLFWADQCQDEVAKLAGDLDPPEPYVFDRGTAADSEIKEERLDVLKELHRILKRSGKCAEDYVCEAAWNEGLHHPVPRLALESYIGIEPRNVYARQHVRFPISYIMVPSVS
jgi:hypothetical protein